MGPHMESRGARCGGRGLVLVLKKNNTSWAWEQMSGLHLPEIYEQA